MPVMVNGIIILCNRDVCAVSALYEIELDGAVAGPSNRCKFAQVFCASRGHAGVIFR